MSPLTKETKLGLNFGQVLTALTLFAMIVGAWVNVKMDIATLYERTNNHESAIIEIKKSMDDFKLDNKQDHKDLMKELIKIGDNFKKK